jgi:DNA-binding NarL/FixJ family response regulator
MTQDGLPIPTPQIGNKRAHSMLDKTVRIIIADRRHEHRLCIEKLLNTLGYFRIVCASSHEEVRKLTQVDTCPVGLLIIDESFPISDHANNLDYPQIRPRTPYILCCRSSDHVHRMASWGKGAPIRHSLAGLPDSHALSTVMRQVYYSASRSERSKLLAHLSTPEIMRHRKV